MPEISPRNFKGTRDYLPAEMIQRNKLLAIIRSTFELYGFVPVETPAMEYLDILLGKYGDEGDKLIYRLAYEDGKTLGLKYDLTVPLSRMISQHSDLVKPLKRYQIQPVWRADRAQPNQGRFREFYQCDADIIGTDSLLADAEILTMALQILKDLDLGAFVLRLNNRKILSALIEKAGYPIEDELIVCRSIDKWHKIGQEGVQKELHDAGYKKDAFEALIELFNIDHSDPIALLKILYQELSDTTKGQKGIQELEQIFHYMEDLQTDMSLVEIDLLLARGLDYYTGAIYEVASKELPHLGSLAGGGRLDHLASIYSGEENPIVGITIGLDRIYTLLKQLNKINEKQSLTSCLLAIYDKNMEKYTVLLMQKLRHEGIPCELYFADDKLKKQFAFADKKGIPYVVILGPEEVAQSMISVKNMKTGNQVKIDFSELVALLKKD